MLVSLKPPDIPVNVQKHRPCNWPFSNLPFLCAELGPPSLIDFELLMKFELIYSGGKAAARHSNPKTPNAVLFHFIFHATGVASSTRLTQLTDVLLSC
jgi:hypothetical protein